MFCVDVVDISEGETPQSVRPNRGSPWNGPMSRPNRPSSYSPTSISKILVHVNKNYTSIVVPFQKEKKHISCYFLPKGYLYPTDTKYPFDYLKLLSLLI